ncbi:phosphatidate cytidylyltransferase [Thioclava sp. SK-1]|nr:phosphatidate cytidylyltransferase [Thioclava sp. SK-1]
MPSGETIALIAGQGSLPIQLAQARSDLLICEMDGFPCGIDGAAPLRFRLERLVPFLDTLVDRGVKQVVFAGAMQRPQIEPELFDMQTMQILPRLMGAMGQGDDATLRAVIELFAEWDLETVGIDQLLPQILPEDGVLTGAVTAADEGDAIRAAAILAAMAPADIGQGCVVAGGLCMAVETLPGTDAMLEFAAHYRDLKPKGGVYFKAPKHGQDRRIDLPAIGPKTVEQVAKAGLAGIVIETGGVMILDRDATLAAANAAGLFIWVRPR